MDAATRKPLSERFWSKVDQGSPDECWPWIAFIAPKGYGLVRDDDQRKIGAHCASWKLHNGPIPEGKFVLHTCDVRSCVNPGHLFLGDAQANSTDMLEKNRSAKKESHGRAKLTEEKVAEIRREYVKGSRTHGTPALARKYRMSYAQMWRIVNLVQWNG